MNKWLIFSVGAISGGVLTLLILFLMGLSSQKNDGLTGAIFFEKPAEVVKEKDLKVIGVVQNNAALVRGKDSPHSHIYLGSIYLIVNHDGHYYYDDEKINVPSKKVVRQVGIYKYTANSGQNKTVPIIEIMNQYN